MKKTMTIMLAYVTATAGSNRLTSAYLDLDTLVMDVKDKMDCVLDREELRQHFEGINPANVFAFDQHQMEWLIHRVPLRSCKQLSLIDLQLV
jgi:hypothetical protein